MIQHNHKDNTPNVKHPCSITTAAAFLLCVLYDGIQRYLNNFQRKSTLNTNILFEYR